MTRDDFCKYHWAYYLVLERDLLKVEQYISFELGNNYLYNKPTYFDAENSNVFSNEFVKQYQAICSEIDVVLKTICKELANVSVDNMKTGYTPIILQYWPDIVLQKVKIKDFELQPFVNWNQSPYKSPDWWSLYNQVKHKRLSHYKNANLKNVLNALAGLYILENYLVRYIGTRDDDLDVPNDKSQLFAMKSFSTVNTVIGRELYVATTKDIDDFF